MTSPEAHTPVLPTPAEPTERAVRNGVRERHARSRREGSLLANVGTYAVLLIGAVLTLAPFLLSVLTSFKTPRQMAAEPALNPPNPVTTENYTRLFGDYGFVSPIAVTAQVAIVVLVGQLVFSIMAAYAFAKLRFPGRDALFWLFLATMMIPQVVTVIPLYTMFSQAGLRNTFWALVLPFMFGSPYAVFLLREYFRGIPDDIIAAAKIDGAGHWRILWQVVVPMSKGIIATLAIITVVSHWNNFMWPLIITTGRDWATLTVATSQLQGQYTSNWTLVMAATTLAMAPLVLLFLVFQRHIIESIALTGLK